MMASTGTAANTRIQVKFLRVRRFIERPQGRAEYPGKDAGPNLVLKHDSVVYSSSGLRLRARAALRAERAPETSLVNGRNGVYDRV